MMSTVSKSVGALKTNKEIPSRNYIVMGGRGKSRFSMWRQLRDPSILLPKQEVNAATELGSLRTLLDWRHLIRITRQVAVKLPRGKTDLWNPSMFRFSYFETEQRLSGWQFDRAGAASVAVYLSDTAWMMSVRLPTALHLDDRSGKYRSTD